MGDSGSKRRQTVARRVSEEASSTWFRLAHASGYRLIKTRTTQSQIAVVTTGQGPSDLRASDPYTLD